MKKEEIIEGKKVVDTWFPDYGIATIKTVKKTFIIIQFKQVLIIYITRNLIIFNVIVRPLDQFSKF